MLSEISPAHIVQEELFADSQPEDKSLRLMAVMDGINQRMGKGAIRLASDGVEQCWHMRRGSVSPAYTCDWGELAQVK